MENNCKQEKNRSIGYQLLGREHQKMENTGNKKYLTHNQGVAGSSPAGPTIDNQPPEVTSGWLVFCWKVDIASVVCMHYF